MRSLIIIIHREPTLNELESKLAHTKEMIRQAPSMLILERLEYTVQKLANTLSGKRNLSGLVKPLRAELQIRRVELIGREYSNEEA